jgi:serine/threonine-protein kinase
VPAPPLLHGKYHLQAELGRGARGIVYKAVDTTRAAEVAIKVLITQAPPETPESAAEMKRFVIDARLTSSMPRHPNIVSIHEADVAVGRAFLSMDYVDGQSLSAWIQKNRPTVRERISLIRTVAEALAHAHALGFVHQNLKPTNVMVDRQNQPHVSDFAVGVTARTVKGLSSTALGVSKGALSYISPEQAMNLKSVDYRTDIFALGAMLFEVLAGRAPFKGTSAVGTLISVVNDAAPRLSAVLDRDMASQMGDGLDPIVQKALSKEPSARQKSAQTFADELGRYLG